VPKVDHIAEIVFQWNVAEILGIMIDGLGLEMIPWARICCCNRSHHAVSCSIFVFINAMTVLVAI
jgi:hypothetical protein